VSWYRKAAEQGNADAQFNLGVCFDIGQGVVKDEEEAMSWYRKAAKQGNAGAQNNLGVCFRNGQGVEKDEAEAVSWYRKAAEQGNAGAQNNLGVCFRNGRGVDKDATQAEFWFRKAAKRGNAKARANLAKYFARGDPIDQDKTGKATAENSQQVVSHDATSARNHSSSGSTGAKVILASTMLSLPPASVILTYRLFFFLCWGFIGPRDVDTDLSAAVPS
jgi:TPR repeat protein